MTLTAGESETLAAILARLIPADELGPGALDAGGLEFVDRALEGELAHLSNDYSAGLAVVDELARERHGHGFHELEGDAQDHVLRALEGTPFFELVRLHAIHGYFADPRHGGNAGEAGWRLIGFPGPKAVFSEHDQRLEAR